MSSKKVWAYFCVQGAGTAIDFYIRAFGAEELYRIPEDDGRIGHAEIRIGETVLMLSDEHPEVGALSPATLKGSCVSFCIEVSDVDAAYAKALAEGATVDRPLKDEPYGRIGWLQDPFGYRWSLITSNPDFKP